MSEPALDLQIPASENAPAIARGAAAALDGTLGTAHEDTVLLISELVTNAVRHSAARDGDPVAVRVRVRGGRVRVAVRDPGPGFAPEPGALDGPPPEGYDGGWGLRLVEMLSCEWGVEPELGGVTVWFELDTAPLQD